MTNPRLSGLKNFPPPRHNEITFVQAETVSMGEADMTTGNK